MADSGNLTGSIRREQLTRYTILPREREPMPTEEVELPLPGPLPNPPNKPQIWLILATPLMSLSFALVTILRSPDQWLIAVPMLIIAVALPGGQMLSYRSQKKKYAEEIEQANLTYRDKLKKKRTHIDGLASRQKQILIDENPPISRLIKRVSGRRKLWLRQPEDDDFLAIRAGTASMPTSFTVKASRGADDEDSRIQEMFSLYRSSTIVRGLPLRVSLRDLCVVGLNATKHGVDVLPTAYAMLINIFAHHSPDQVEVYFFSGRSEAEGVWSWLKWIPHLNAIRNGGEDSRIAFTLPKTEKLLSQLYSTVQRRSNPARADSHVLVIVDHAPTVLNSPAFEAILAANPDMRISALFIESPIPPSCRGLVSVDDRGDVFYRNTSGESASEDRFKGGADTASFEDCEVVARSLAPLSPDSQGAVELPTSIRLVELLGADQADEVNFEALYNRHHGDVQLNFPIGLNRELKPLTIPLTRVGYHGVLAGATGMGKSVLLKTLVLSLAASYSPLHVNIMLGDFKQGATELKDLRDLPHVVGYVGDLDPEMADRARKSLQGEIQRRQRQIDQAGEGVQDIHAYNRRFPDKPIPYLIVLFDEYERAEKINDAFPKLMNHIGTTGRAMGVHAFLATQRPSVFRSDLLTNIGYRLSLKLQNSDDSRALFSRTEAYDGEGMSVRGRGYIKYTTEGDIERFEMFQTAHTLSQFGLKDDQPEILEAYTINLVKADGSRSHLLSDKPDVPPSSNGTSAASQTEGEVLRDRIKAYCKEVGYPQSRQIYLDPLPTADDLPLITLIQEGHIFQGWDENGWWNQPVSPDHRLVVPLGDIDLPEYQLQETWSVDLNESDGNLWILGAPGSGRSIVTQSLLLALCVSHSPRDLNIYGLNLGDGILRPFARFPHCNGNIVEPHEQERINRTLQFMKAEVTRRHNILATEGASSISDYREEHSDSSVPTIVFVIDDFGRFNREYMDEIGQIVDLTSQSRTVDIHVVITSTAANDVRNTVRANVSSRIVMQLNSLDDYFDLIGHRPTAVPSEFGRGFIRIDDEPVVLQVASPVMADGEEVTASLNETARSMSESWSGEPMPLRISELPRHIHLPLIDTTVPPIMKYIGSVPVGPLGRNHSDLEPVWIDLQAFGPVAVIVGPPGSGKTELLVNFGVNMLRAQEGAIKLHVLDLQNGNLRHLGKLPDVTTIPEADAPAYLTNLGAEMRAAAADARAKAAEMTLDSMQQQITALLVDDLQGLVRRPDILSALNSLATIPAESGLRIIFAARPNDVLQNRMMNEFVKQACASGSAIVTSMDPAALDLVGLQLQLQTRRKYGDLPTGRGVLNVRGDWQVVQFGSITPADAGTRVGGDEYRNYLHAAISEG